jgi:hypothetical protein
MTKPIHIGDRGKTVGPLKPTGYVRVNDQTIEASSEGVWIDSDSDIVIVGGNTRRAIVRMYSSETICPRNSRERLPAETAIETTPLQSPLSCVERGNSVVVGLVIGIVIVPVAWLSGMPLSVFALLVPLSGAIAGWLFRSFVGSAIQTVGPREDHRPRARATALLVLTCTLVASVIGVNIGLGFLGLCGGIPLGAFLGGMLAYIGWIISNV